MNACTICLLLTGLLLAPAPMWARVIRPASLSLVAGPVRVGGERHLPHHREEWIDPAGVRRKGNQRGSSVLIAGDPLSAGQRRTGTRSNRAADYRPAPLPGQPDHAPCGHRSHLQPGHRNSEPAPFPPSGRAGRLPAPRPRLHRGHCQRQGRHGSGQHQSDQTTPEPEGDTGPVDQSPARPAAITNHDGA